MSFQSLINHYVHGIIRRSQGLNMSGIEMFHFIACRNQIMHGLETQQWLDMGLDIRVINVVMQTGDEFLTDGNAEIALHFFRETSYLFPGSAICCIREAQCHIVLDCFDHAKKACRKAIYLSDEYEFDELLSVIEIFTECGRLQQAYGLYLTLMEKFPHHYCFVGKVKELEILLRNKEEEEKKNKGEEIKTASMMPGGITGTTGKNVGQTSDEKLNEACGGIEQSSPTNITGNAKVVRTSRQLKRERIVRDEEIQQEIKKAKTEQEEMLRKQAEVEERKRKEREMKEEMLRKQAEVEARKRKEREMKEEMLRKQAEVEACKRKEREMKEEMLRKQAEVEARKRKEREMKEEKFRKQAEVEARKRKDREEKEEMLRKEEEMEARKRKEREEKEEMLRKQEEMEARKRKEREEDEKKLEKLKNDESKKQQEKINEDVGKKSSKSSCGDQVMNTQATRFMNSSSTNVALPKKDKISLHDMPTDYDHILSSGSQLRRVCTTCNTTRAFSLRRCNSCKSRLLIWYRKVNTTNWINPRKPPIGIFRGRYVQCKDFRRGKVCVKTPCNFAHGQDEVEFWELCRLKGATQKAQPMQTQTTVQAKQYHSRNGGLKEHNASVSSLQKSSSCITLNVLDFGTGLRSRTASLSSLRSLQSSSNRFDVLSTGDTIMLDEFDLDSEYSSYLSQDGFHESSQVSAGPSTSSLSLNVDIDASPTGEVLPQNPVTIVSITPVLTDQSGWMEEGKQKKPQRIVSVKEFKRGKNRKKKKEASLDQQINAKSATQFRSPADGVHMGRYKLCHRFEKGRCFFGNRCTFAHGREECSYWIALYQRQTQLQKKRLLTESFSEMVRRRVRHEGEHHVLKENLLGVTVNCNSPWQVKLDGPQEYMWIFDVRIQRKYQLLLSQVAFLLETHLDKFKFLRSATQNRSSNTESVQLLGKDFVDDLAKQESAVQFCIQFSSSVFGDFEQKLVFDFGHGSVLALPLYVSVVSKDICSSKDDFSTRTTYCSILEWSVEKMELVLCEDLIGVDSSGLCEQYSIPNVLPDPAESVEFTRETYCKLWHDIMFLEEEHIQAEVARYDIHDGAMKVINSFQSADETIFALPGELFGEIYLSDYLVMDEVAGHLINRSVMSVILRPKVDHSQSNRVYECSIKLKTSQLVIIKLNEVLCKDYVFVKDQEIYIDLKFRYNRFLMCAMHQAIDMCKEKTKVLLPNVKNVSYTNKKSIHDWFMDRKPNANQHEAIAMILDPRPTPPILVIGPFGTGKTFTLSVACVSILSQSERNKVLICTHTNSAADIHLAHLDAKIATKPSLNIRPLRINQLHGKVQNIPEKLRKYCLIEETTYVIKRATSNEIRDHNVIITTLATARMLWKFYQDGRLRFTHILIDEAAQALEPECVTPLVMADGNTKIVLAGDHMQMGPPVYSKCQWAEDFGPKISLLQRLHTHYGQYNKTSSNLKSSSVKDKPPYVVLLTENYRCHADILKFPSDCFYGGELVARGDQSTHELLPVLSFYAAQGVDQQVEGSLEYFNVAEVAEVVKRVEELVYLSKDWSKNIGVLTPYRDQVRRIREGLRKKGLGYVDVEKVENVQGKEFKVLFISTVRTMQTCSWIEDRNSDHSELDFGFLSDPRFLNTAVTRAQSLLAVVGDPFSLCSVGECRNLWKDYLQRCDANKGLYGCTLKTVMDFCLCSQALDPGAHEFTPNKDETLISTSSKGNHEVSEEENAIGSNSKASYSVSTSHDFTSTAMAGQNTQFVSRSVVDGHGGIGGTMADSGGDLAVDNNETSHDENAPGKEDEDEDGSETNQSATDNFFRRDGIENFDKIIEELIKACHKTKEKDESRQQNATVEDFPPLNDVSVSTKTSAPHWRNISNLTFSAGLKDGQIELGFHVKESERLFRLTGGKLSFKENGDNQSCHDIKAFPQEELLKLVKENPTDFIKCTFRVGTSGQQHRYYGQLPTPDSPDIDIPGRVQGVYEDDVVVLELQPRVWVQNEGGQEEILIFGYIKGILRRLIEPKERQFVCTVDRANLGVMVPINKSLPKIVNFTKTDENNIPIYSMKDGQVTQVRILKRKHYAEALAGERVFVVKYLQWRNNCPYPLGLAIRDIPHGRDFKTGMEILYAEHNIKREFDKKLRASVKREFNENWQVPASEKGRPVYRDNVFTIDPPESLDLDDAISIQSLSNGNYDLHIHIADVSYFVLPNTPLDEEARLRGTSYYPPKPHETVPMLPRELSQNCCSLLKGKDRLALTLSVEVTPDGTVDGDARIERSVICSSARLTYLQAQKLIDETSQTEVPINGEARRIPVEEAIGVVHHISQGRRRLRLGVERSLYERKREDCDDHDDENEREAHQMIEEIMVMANHLVAKYLLEKFPKCTPLRVQPPPKARRVIEWRQRFQKFLNFALGMERLGDTQIAQDETVELKVPCMTWSMIMSEVGQDSNFQELVKVVCDLDLFPQLALANVHQRQLQQRGRYICSGETLEGIPFPWPRHEKEAPADQQNIDTDVSSNVPEENVSLSENHEASSCSFVNEGAQFSANVPNEHNLKNILHGHWNLCLDAYCHFTSPIRRYIDIIVHRLVVASIEDRPSTMDSDDITTLCDRCTFFARNSGRFDKDARKLRLAVNLQSSLTFVSAFIDKVAADELKLFFGTGEFELLPGRSVCVARLGPDNDPEEVGDHIKLRWTFRFLRLDKHGRAQPRLHISDDDKSQDLAKKLERQLENENVASDDDFDYTVSSEHWIGVLEAVKSQNEDELKSRLQEIDDNIRKQENPNSSTKTTLRKRMQNDPGLSSSAAYQHPNVGKPEPSEKETDEFFEVTRSFKPYDRVKVQICCQMSQGVLSPTIQLFKLTDQIHACIEHRSSPIICFAKTSHMRLTNTVFYDVTEYVKLWKPVLMMEIVTSAVRDNDVIILSNLLVSLVRDSKGLVTMEFNLSNAYIRDHDLDPLDLNLMCVRVRVPDGSGKDTGYWVGHFQISEELRKKEDARKILEEAENNAKKHQDARLNPTPLPDANINNRKANNKPNAKKDQYRSVLARLIYSSTPVPESLITQRYCYVTVELICLSIPNRRCHGALVNTVTASELVQDICTGNVSTDLHVGGKLPIELSLCNVHSTLQTFYPLNKYQQHAVQEALSKSFTLIQGPPGTGKTVTGVHIAYWFAQLNQKRVPTVEKEEKASNGSMVFYCGPSNKSVDVVARYLVKIPDLKILRIYGQGVEQKLFPVPDKITLFRSKHVPAQLAADEELKDVSLHHVIRSKESPLAEELKNYDKVFKKYLKDDCNAPREMIADFNKLKSKAEKWAITQRGVNVILLTCTTAYSSRIRKPCKGFVCQCIIDECGMCIEAETLCAMMGSKAKQVVLIGDHKQLQPVVQCKNAKRLGLGISMFERFSDQAQMLKIQYRMHEELCEFPSKFFYNGKLQTAREVLDRAPDNVKWPNGDRYPFVFHHVEGDEESLIVTTDQGNQNSKKNQKEIEKVVHVARSLTGQGIKGDDIVILSPYRAQCFEITEKLKQHVGLNGISVMSVVAAQGSEKNYVILSLVRSLPERQIEIKPSRSWLSENLGFITDPHLINVALTRAKRGLCIVGNANLIGVCSMWRALLEHYKQKSCLVMNVERTLDITSNPSIMN